MIIMLCSDIFRWEEIGENECPEKIKGLYKSLYENLYSHDIKLYKLSDEGIYGIKSDIDVDLPARGTVNGIDIRKKESILYLVDINSFPYKAPLVLSNRIDFPMEKLPHLIISTRYPIPILCLHRGNLNDWFIQHTVDDFVTRIRSWFRDAACNRLIKENDGFEETRIIDEAGIIIYDVSRVNNFIHKYWSMRNNQRDFGFFVFKEYEDNSLNIVFPPIEIVDIFYRNQYTEMANKYVELNKQVNGYKYLFGLIIWTNKNTVNNNYFGVLPKKLDKLIQFGENNDLKVYAAINFYAQRISKITNVPMICAIRRPTKLIGRDYDIEFLHFAFDGSKKDHHGKYSEDAEVKMIVNMQPIDFKYARKLSAIDDMNSYALAIVGCGALGSKVSSHLSRAGYNNQLLIDNDQILPHNIIRHALYSDMIGVNKAEALADSFKNFYKDDMLSNYKPIKDSIFSAVQDFSIISTEQCTVLCDFTASASVMEFLIDKKDNLPPVIRGEIAYNGKLGFLYMEGKYKNPGLEHLQTVLFNCARELNELSEWLKDFEEKVSNKDEAELEEITIGMGCSSDTFRISDDVISNHASLFSTYIRKNLGSEKLSGQIVINYFDSDNICKNYTKVIEVPGFLSIPSECGQWIIYISTNIYNKMMIDLHKHAPNETGGILIGSINIIKKTIIVVDTFTPKDSQRGPYAFERGVNDLPETIVKIKHETGGILGYVGEWHSHPKGALILSHDDKDTLCKIKNNLSKVNIPTHICIINENNIASFVS